MDFWEGGSFSGVKSFYLNDSNEFNLIIRMFQWVIQCMKHMKNPVDQTKVNVQGILSCIILCKEEPMWIFLFLDV